MRSLAVPGAPDRCYSSADEAHPRLPRFPDSLWSFAGTAELFGLRTLHAAIGLATLAALTPPDWQIRIVDENIEDIDFDVDSDVVGTSIFNVQYRRAVEIAGEFRRRGRWVVERLKRLHVEIRHAGGSHLDDPPHDGGATGSPARRR